MIYAKDKLKNTKMYDGPNGSQPEWKSTTMKDHQNRRPPK